MYNFQTTKIKQQPLFGRLQLPTQVKTSPMSDCAAICYMGRDATTWMVTRIGDTRWSQGKSTSEGIYELKFRNLYRISSTTQLGWCESEITCFHTYYTHREWSLIKQMWCRTDRAELWDCALEQKTVVLLVQGWASTPGIALYLQGNYPSFSDST